MHTHETVPLTPWYRQFWPWFLIALPTSTVIAGIATWMIAAHAPDSLVVDDYYKAGLAINQNLARDEQAAILGLEAELRIDAEGVALRVQPAVMVPEDNLTLALHHPTRAALDRVVELSRVATGEYRVMDAGLVGTRWDVTLTPPSTRWRLAGTLDTAASETLSLRPAASATRR